MKAAVVTWLTLSFTLRAATLQGHVRSDDGNVVDNVVVSAQLTVINGAFTTYRTVTDAQGRFSINVTDPGTYSICVGSFDRSLLNTCDWYFQKNLVTLKTANATASIKIVLVTGVRIHIRIDDPGDLLTVLGAPPSATTKSAQFGIMTPDGHYHVAIQVSSDNLGQNHEVLVAPGTDIVLISNGSGVQVLSTAIPAVGAKPTAAGVSVPAASLLQAPVFRFQAAPLAVATPVAK